jgi:hypothetical protein
MVHRFYTIGYCCTQFIVISTINDPNSRYNFAPMLFIAILCITSIVWRPCESLGVFGQVWVHIRFR